MTDPQVPPTFRLAYVPGVTPGKWVRIWEERLPDVPLELIQAPVADAPGMLREGAADAGLVRLPIDREGLHAIPLYEERTVVVVPKEHVIAAVDEVAVEDLADENVLHPLDDVYDWERPPGRPAYERPPTIEGAFAWVAASVGLLVVPQSLARLYHRKDLTYRPVVDAPGSGVALSWPIGEDGENGEYVEEFIGIVRGRTVNSSRGRGAEKVREKAKPEAARAARKAEPQRKGGAAKGGGAKGGAAKGAGGKGAGTKAAGRGRPRRRS